jgi:RNA polymerase sigma-70 factor (ECF subfamily)
VTDEALVARARAGDTAAFDQLVCRHEAAVYRATFAALRVREDAEDAAQDAFVRAWSSLNGFRGDATFRTWILTIAWRRALSRRRRVTRWLQRRVALDDMDEPRGVDAASSEALDAGELRRHATRAIERLSPRLRDALLLAAAGDYDYGEIAAMLNIPIGTLKWRVAEARKRVRDELAKLGYVTAR